MGILTVAVVTKPFPFEARKRMKIAEKGIEELSQYVDSLITIPNEKLLTVLGKDTSLLKAFEAANNVLLGAVQGIADLIIRPGLINVDFADVRTVMSERGMAMMGTGHASGENKAIEAAEAAIKSPLLEDVNIQGSRGMLVNITASEEISLGDYSAVGDIVEEFASDDATVVVGTVIDPEMGDSIKVTVVATGIGEPVKLVVDNNPVPSNSNGEVDYDSMSRPTVFRQKGQVSGGAAAQSENLDYLDVPAFIRRQAD